MKTLQYIGFLILLITNSIAFSNKIEKGFEDLQKFNYFEAKEIFYSTLKKHTSPSAFGLATIYYKNDNPFHSLDSAYKYICLSESTYSLMEDKEKVKLKQYAFEYLAIIELRSKISTSFYELAHKENTIEAYNLFIAKHEWSTERFTAIHLRDSIAFYQAKNEFKSDKFLAFSTTYPESEYLKEAEKLYQLSLYREKTSSGKLADYLSFVKSNPTSPHTKEAEDRIYELSTLGNTIPDYLAFIKTYTENHNTGNAWKRLYQLFMYEYSDERIQQFQQEYPEYPFKQDLQKDLELARLKLLPFKENSLFGFMDFNGNVIIPATYEALGFFEEGLAFAEKNGKYGYIDKANQVVIDFQFDSASDFEEGRATVEKDKKVGIIDRAGQIIFDLKYNDIGTFSEGLIYAQIDSLYGYFDKIGTQRIAPKFEEAFGFNKGIAKIQINGKQGFIDTYGSNIVPALYEEIQFFTDSLLIFKDKEKYGLMKRNCQIVDSAIFDKIGPLANDRAVVLKNGKIGYIDNKGQIVLDCKFDDYPNAIELSQFKGSYAVVSSKGKFGLIEQFGKFIIPPSYTKLGGFSPLMAFTKGKGWGYIDMNNNTIIQPQFESAESFKNGYAIVERLTLFGLIDAKANVTIPLNFTEIKFLDQDKVLVTRGPNSGIYKSSGQELVPVEYQQIRILNKELVLLTKSGEVSYFYLPENRIISKK